MLCPVLCCVLQGDVSAVLNEVGGILVGRAQAAAVGSEAVGAVEAVLTQAAADLPFLMATAA